MALARSELEEDLLRGAVKDRGVWQIICMLAPSVCKDCCFTHQNTSYCRETDLCWSAANGCHENYYTCPSPFLFNLAAALENPSVLWQADKGCLKKTKIAISSLFFSSLWWDPHLHFLKYSLCTLILLETLTDANNNNKKKMDLWLSHFTFKHSQVQFTHAVIPFIVLKCQLHFG